MMDLIWQIPAALVGLPLGFAGTRWMLLWGLHDEKVDSTPQVEVYEKPVELVQKFHSASETSEAFLHRDINDMKRMVDKKKDWDTIDLIEDLYRMAEDATDKGLFDVSNSLIEAISMLKAGHSLKEVTYFLDLVKEEISRKNSIRKTHVVVDRNPQVKLYPLNYVSKSTDSISYERIPPYRPEDL